MRHATPLFPALLFSNFLRTCVRAKMTVPVSFLISGQVFGTNGQTITGATTCRV